MEGMFKDTGLVGLDLYHDPHAALNKKMGNFDEADLQKCCARAQVEYDEIVTIARRSRQIGGGLQTQTKIAPPPGLNIAPD